MGSPRAGEESSGLPVGSSPHQVDVQTMVFADAELH